MDKSTHLEFGRANQKSIDGKQPPKADQPHQIVINLPEFAPSLNQLLEANVKAGSISADDAKRISSEQRQGYGIIEKLDEMLDPRSALSLHRELYQITKTAGEAHLGAFSSSFNGNLNREREFIEATINDLSMLRAALASQLERNASALEIKGKKQISSLNPSIKSISKALLGRDLDLKGLDAHLVEFEKVRLQAWTDRAGTSSKLDAADKVFDFAATSMPVANLAYNLAYQIKAVEAGKQSEIDWGLFAILALANATLLARPAANALSGLARSALPKEVAALSGALASELGEVAAASRGLNLTEAELMQRIAARLGAAKSGLRHYFDDARTAFRRSFGQMQPAYETNVGTNNFPAQTKSPKPFTWDDFEGTAKAGRNIQLATTPTPPPSSSTPSAQAASSTAARPLPGAASRGADKKLAKQLYFTALGAGHAWNWIDFKTDVSEAKKSMDAATTTTLNKLLESSLTEFNRARGQVDGKLEAARISAVMNIFGSKRERDLAVQTSTPENPANVVYGQNIDQLPKHIQLMRGLIMQKISLERQQSGLAKARLVIDPAKGNILDEGARGPDVPEMNVLHGQIVKNHELNVLYMTRAPNLLYGENAPRPDPKTTAEANTILTPDQQASARMDVKIPDPVDPLSLKYALTAHVPPAEQQRYLNAAGNPETLLSSPAGSSQETTLPLTKDQQENILKWQIAQQDLLTQLNISITELRRRSGYFESEPNARESERLLFAKLQRERAQQAAAYVTGALFSSALGQFYQQGTQNDRSNAANLPYIEEIAGQRLEQWLSALPEQTRQAEKRKSELAKHLSLGAGRAYLQGLTLGLANSVAPKELGTPATGTGASDPLKLAPAAAMLILPQPGAIKELFMFLAQSGVKVAPYAALFGYNALAFWKVQEDSNLIKGIWDKDKLEHGAYTSSLTSSISPKMGDVLAQRVENRLKVATTRLEEDAKFISGYYNLETQLRQRLTKQNFQNAITQIIGRTKSDPGHDGAWQAKAINDKTAYSIEADIVIRETNKTMDSYYNSLLSLTSRQMRNAGGALFLPLVPGMGGPSGQVGTAVTPRPKVELAKPPDNMRD